MESFLINWTTIVAGVLGFFEVIENSAKPEAKKSTATWMRSVGIVGSADTWQSQVVSIFDGLYGERVVSLRFLFRSIISTIICMTFALIWLTVMSHDLVLEAEWNFSLSDASTLSDIFSELSNFALTAVGILVPILLINIIPDYLSLIETRLVLEQMKKERKLSATIFFLLFDLIFTTVIYFVYLVNVYWLVAEAPLDEIRETGLFWWLPAVGLMGGALIGGGLGFFSTYVTSIWVFTYVIAGACFRVIRRMLKPIEFLRTDVIDLDKHPFRMLGLTISLVFTMVMVIIKVLAL